jgi:hypothetical protein
MTPAQIAILNPVLVGLATSLGTILVHGLIVSAVVWSARHDLKTGLLGPRYWSNLAFVSAATLMILAGHFVEIAMWGGVFELCGEFGDFAGAFYHSAVNYTTLGYGDVIMSTRWRLLGPLEAADGMLMFGVSTALIFTVLQRLIQTRLGLVDHQ